MLSRFSSRRHFDDLSEQEVLALAISNEEDDARIYRSFAERLREAFPASAAVFDGMAAEEDSHRHRLIELRHRLRGAPHEDEGLAPQHPTRHRVGMMGDALLAHGDGAGVLALGDQGLGQLDENGRRRILSKELLVTLHQRFGHAARDHSTGAASVSPPPQGVLASSG